MSCHVDARLKEVGTAVLRDNRDNATRKSVVSNHHRYRVRSASKFSFIVLTVIYMIFLSHSLVRFDATDADYASSENDLPTLLKKSPRRRVRSKSEESLSTNEDSSNAPGTKIGTKSCNLLSESNGGPTPVILMSLGRSGSSSVWQVMGKMTGKVTPSVEYTGKDSKQSMKFFTNTVKGNDDWLTEYLCERQTEYPDAGIVGFKWKPHQSIYTNSAKAGLASIATSKDPTVKVVRSRRNLLDVVISGTKHRTSRQKAHCGVDDKECIERHLKAGSGLKLDTKSLVKKLREKKKEEDDVDNLLGELGVPHVRVSFERLFHSDDAEEWMRIFRFLARGPSEGLNREEVARAMEHAATSHTEHNVTLSNYEEVRLTLQGTEFEGLLH